MPKASQMPVHAVREAAYFIWEREGRPEGRALEHWARAVDEIITQQRGNGEAKDDYEIVVDGSPGANMPALLTKDVLGG